MFKMAKKILSIDGKPSTSGPSASSTGGGSSSKKSKEKKEDNLNASMKRLNTDELNDFSKLEEDPRLPLNKRQIFKITKSWKAIARTMCKTGTAMFLNLFEENEDLFYLFDRFQHLKKNELQESMELKEHAATVMSTLDQSISTLNDYDNFITYLRSIGEMHRKIPEFKREHFWKIEEPFMKAVKQTLDERCNETIEEIYRIAIKLIIETIAEGYGQDQTSNEPSEFPGSKPRPSPSSGEGDKSGSGATDSLECRNNEQHSSKTNGAGSRSDNVQSAGNGSHGKRYTNTKMATTTTTSIDNSSIEAASAKAELDNRLKPTLEAFKSMLVNLSRNESQKRPEMIDRSSSMVEQSIEPMASARHIRLSPIKSSMTRNETETETETEPIQQPNQRMHDISRHYSIRNGSNKRVKQPDEAGSQTHTTLSSTYDQRCSNTNVSHMNTIQAEELRSPVRLINSYSIKKKAAGTSSIEHKPIRANVRASCLKSNEDQVLYQTSEVRDDVILMNLGDSDNDSCIPSNSVHSVGDDVKVHHHSKLIDAGKDSIGCIESKLNQELKEDRRYLGHGNGIISNSLNDATYYNGLNDTKRCVIDSMASHRNSNDVISLQSNADSIRDQRVNSMYDQTGNQTSIVYSKHDTKLRAGNENQHHDIKRMNQSIDNIGLDSDIRLTSNQDELCELIKMLLLNIASRYPRSLANRLVESETVTTTGRI